LQFPCCDKHRQSFISFSQNESDFLRLEIAAEFPENGNRVLGESAAYKIN
jgi:hypothetical protein